MKSRNPSLPRWPVALLAVGVVVVASLAGGSSSSSSILVVAAETSSSSSSSSSTVVASEGEEFVCSLYLAPSSKHKSDDFKWGTYTAKAIPSGERIGPETLAIPLYNFRANNRRPSHERATYWEQLATHVLNFMWQPEMGGAADEQLVDETDPLATCLAMPGPGMSAAFDSPTAAANADWDVAAAYRRTGPSAATPEAGRAHPGRAATSQFDRVTLRATQPIQAGEEVVVGYDDPVLSSPERDPEEDAVTEEDFSKMDQTIAQMVAFFDKHSALEDSAKQQIYQFLIQDFMEAAVGAVKARKVAEIMPPTPADLKAVQTAGGIRNYANGTATIQRQRLEWLRRTGYCLDHVRPAPSSIPNAGLGAFATHRLPKDSVITPVPLLHIADSSALDMFDLVMDESTGMWSRDPSAFVGQQLLTNYVFGHPKSTMVFLPTSSAIVYVNHDDTPNARLRWADSSQVGHANADWMEIAPNDMVESDQYHTVGLLMELVALRDIEPGEEVTIDYGAEWKRAWDAHQKSWQEAAPASWPLRAVDLNARHLTAVLPTEAELEEATDESMSYPDDVSLKAFIMIAETDGKGQGTEKDPYQYVAPEHFGQVGTATLFDVEVIDRASTPESEASSSSASSLGVDSYTYTVRVEYEEESSFVSGVPHHAFVFVDNAESGDQFAVDVEPFRHVIGIPDDVFPQGPWRNKHS